MLIGFRHVGIVCGDIEKAAIFYKLLGFNEVWRESESGEWLNTILGLVDGSLSTVKLKDGNGIIIELLRFNVQKNETTSRTLNERGITHIALTVSNVGVEFERLSAAGVKFHSEPRISGSGYAKLCFCQDTEGNEIELVEVLNKTG